MKLKLEWRITAPLAITLLHLTAHNTVNAQTAQAAASPTKVAAAQATPTSSGAANDVSAARAAAAAHRDTDPKLNGSIGDVPEKPSSK